LTNDKTRRVIFWDFDGTLVLNSKWSLSLMKALDERHPGHGTTREELGASLHEDFPWHDHEQYHPELSSPGAWWDRVRPLLARACRNAGYDGAESDRLAEIAQATILRPETYRLYDDTLPVLEDLKAKGWRHFILSNNFPELPDIVEKLSFGRLIDGCVTSGLTGYEKPNPGIFRYALDLAGHPEKAWMVGDNVFADVRGAEAMGIPAVLIHFPVEETVRYYASSLVEAAQIIENNP
jgi:putative hydrolase of the HAD superfamily